MKNSNYIEMIQCNVFSIKFPVENVADVLEKATFEDKGNIKVEIVTNPLVNKKVVALNKGLFFTMRTTFKKITKEILTNKIFELKERPEFRDRELSAKEWKEIAEDIIWGQFLILANILMFIIAQKKKFYLRAINQKEVRQH